MHASWLNKPLKFNSYVIDVPSILLWLVVFASPIAHSRIPLLGINITPLRLIFIMYILYLLSNFISRSLRVYIPRHLFYIFYAFLAWRIFGLSYSDNIVYGIKVAGSTFEMVLLFFIAFDLTFRILNSGKDYMYLRKLVYTAFFFIFIIELASVILQLLSMIGIGPGMGALGAVACDPDVSESCERLTGQSLGTIEGGGIRFTGTLGDPSTFGCVLVLLFSAFLRKYLTFKGILAILACAISAFIFLFIGSRTTVLVALFVAIDFYLRGGKKFFQFANISYSQIALIIIIFIPLSYLIVNYSPSILRETGQVSLIPTSLEKHVEYLVRGLSVFNNNIIFGSGTGAMTQSWMNLGTFELGISAVHNGWLSMLAEGGSIMGIILLLLIFEILRILFFPFINIAHNKDKKFLLDTARDSFVILFFACLVYDELFSNLILWTIIGVGVSCQIFNSQKDILIIRQ